MWSPGGDIISPPVDTSLRPGALIEVSILAG